MLSGPPTGFWGPGVLTRNEALDHTRGDYCVKHNQHTSCYLLRDISNAYILPQQNTIHYDLLTQ